MVNGIINSSDLKSVCLFSETLNTRRVFPTITQRSWDGLEMDASVDPPFFLEVRGLRK